MLVATDIAARGIDVTALGHVINFDVPMQPEDYIHRVGRTARAELTGTAFTLVSSDEEGDLRAIEKAIGRRLPRVTVPDFDYDARAPAERLEVPHAQRIAEIRARKADERDPRPRQRRAPRVPRRRPSGHGQQRPQGQGPVIAGSGRWSAAAGSAAVIPVPAEVRPRRRRPAPARSETSRPAVAVPPVNRRCPCKERYRFVRMPNVTRAVKPPRSLLVEVLVDAPPATERVRHVAVLRFRRHEQCHLPDSDVDAAEPSPAVEVLRRVFARSAKLDVSV